MFGIKLQEKDLDLSLLQRAAQGERTAFDTFVSRHQAAVYRFARSLSSESQAEEILQRTFIEAWRGAGGYSAEGSARSWLFTIARRSLLKLERKRVGEPADFDALDDLGCKAGWGSGAPSLAARLEERDWLSKALAALSDADRELLLLVEVEGMTLAESATLTGATVAATKSRLHRARLALMCALRKEQDIGG